MEITAYNPRSLASSFLYAIAFLCILFRSEQNDLNLVGLLALLGAIVLGAYGERRSNYDKRYRKEFPLKYDQEKIILGKYSQIMYEAIYDISFEDGKLKLLGAGFPNKFNICEGQSDKINSLMKLFVDYKKSKDFTNSYMGFDVTYLGTKMDIHIDSDSVCERSLRERIDAIDKALYIESASVWYPDGAVEVYNLSGNDSVWEQIHNKLINRTPGGACH
ncbi:MAG: hypothetical protein MI976_15440 [Pseudomonadales bacterium]|nr:hypothetical protein [Pseudomonadales bacterium]